MDVDIRDTKLTSALVDRLVHHAHFLSFTGQSFASNKQWNAFRTEFSMLASGLGLLVCKTKHFDLQNTINHQFNSIAFNFPLHKPIYKIKL